MGTPNKPSRSAGPAVVVTLSPDAEPFVSDLQGRFTRASDKTRPPQCQFVAAQEDLADRLPLALGAAMDIRHSVNGFGLALPMPAAPLAPDVIFVASATSLPRQMPVLHQALAIVRREFRRSQWLGRVVVLLYRGAIGHEQPADEALAALRLPEIDLIYVFSDTDGAGRRLRWADALRVGGQLLAALLTEPAVREITREIADGIADVPTAFSFGIRRLDVSTQPLQRLRGREVVRHLGVWLRKRADTDSDGKAPTTDGSVLTAACPARNGSAQDPYDAALSVTREPTITVGNERLRAAKEHTRASMRKLLPQDPPPRRSWLRWLWDLSYRLIFRRQNQPPTVAPSADFSAAQRAASTKLLHSESVRWQLTLVESILRSLDIPAEGSCHSPFEMDLTDLPAVRQAFQANVPELERIAVRLGEGLQIDRLIALSDQPHRLRSQLAALIDRELPPQTITISPADYRGAVEQMAATLLPVEPGCAEPDRYLALLPPRLFRQFALNNYRQAPSADDAVTLLVFQVVPRENLALAEAPTHDHTETGHVAIAEPLAGAAVLHGLDGCGRQCH